MSEKSISLVSEPQQAGVHYLESAIKGALAPIEPGFQSAELVLGRKDSAWDPDGGLFRGPDIILYILNESDGKISAYPMENHGF